MPTMHLSISDASNKRLEALRLKTEATNKSEVIANSLKLYEWMVDEVEAGREFFIKSADGSIVPANPFGVPGPVAASAA